VDDGLNDDGRDLSRPEEKPPLHRLAHPRDRLEEALERTLLALEAPAGRLRPLRGAHMLRPLDPAQRPDDGVTGLLLARQDDLPPGCSWPRRLEVHPAPDDRSMAYLGALQDDLDVSCDRTRQPKANLTPADEDVPSLGRIQRDLGVRLSRSRDLEVEPPPKRNDVPSGCLLSRERQRRNSSSDLAVDYLTPNTEMSPSPDREMRPRPEELDLRFESPEKRASVNPATHSWT
jgi:hypothetical protein